MALHIIIYRNLEGSLVLVELSESHPHQLVVIFRTCLLRRQFHTDIIVSKAMHGSASWSFLEQHLHLFAYKPLVESQRLIVGQLKQALRS